MSRPMPFDQLPLRLAVLTGFTILIIQAQTAWCQTSKSGATAPSSESTTNVTNETLNTFTPGRSPKAVTVDPDVTTAHLKLFVKPLTVNELVVEAKGWQNLLKNNVEKITMLQLRIEQISNQIAALKSSDTAAVPQASPAAATPSPKDSTSTSTQTSANDSPPSSTQTASVATLTQQRDQFSRQLTALTLKKTEISQKFDVVLNNLELKGGDPATYRKYNAALTGVALEVTTATGMWQMLIGWMIADQGGKRWAWNLIRFIVILLVSYFGASVLANFVRRGASRVKGVSQLLVNFLSSFTKQVSMVVGFIIGLAALEIDITPLIAAVGAAGFVVAFALQGTLSNFASGLLILAYRPFDVGDVIEAAGVSGNVDSVSLFSTHIRTFDNKLMIVPNNDIWGGTITNATASTTRRVDLVFGIGYADDINEAKNILATVVETHPLVLKEPAANIRVNELGDSSVNLICRPWTKTENYWSVYWDLMQAVKQEFDNAGVSIPFPQRDVHIHQHNSPK